MSTDPRVDEGRGSETTSSIPPDDQTTQATMTEEETTGDPADDRVATDHADASGGDGALLPSDQNDRFKSRWEEIQAGFVDEPQKAVEEADALVADLAQRVTASLTKERERLEGQWAAGDDVSTEDLRVALTRYRTFFDRLLAA
jgi:hypothetical protein